MRSMIRILAVVSVTHAGCGSVVKDDPADADWMLGTFSFKSAVGTGGMGGAARFELFPDGDGQAVGIDCEETITPLAWEEQDDGSVKVEVYQDTHPTTIVFAKSVCTADGLVAHPGQRAIRESPDSTSEAFSEVTLYRSIPCAGDYIPGDDCEDDGNECDPRGYCEIVWCEGGEPERCE